MASRASRSLSPRRMRAPALWALAAICVVSLLARAAWIEEPCRSPCTKATDHVLIFDEDYYVNAARVIAGIRPPTGAPYAGAPSGDDPNAEHPQLAKLTIAGLIELLGDGPLAWRLPSLVLGTLCLLGMYALVRAAGGGPWLACGAAALMAADNLLLVHSRIATLDVYALTGMLWGVVAYLRGRPWLGGAIIGVGACAKLVAPYALAVVALVELFGWLAERRTGPAGHRDGAWRAALPRIGRLAGCVAAAGAVLIGLLAVLDDIAPPYDNAAAKLVRGGPFAHLAHMFSYAAHQTSPHGPQGIASYPWDWLFDVKPITYLNIVPSRPVAGLVDVHPAAHFVGVMNPPILLAGLIGLVVAAVVIVRAARGESALTSPSIGGGLPVSILALAWFLGSYLPFVALSLMWQRTSYIYYMVIVMPGLYVAGAQVGAWLRRYPRLFWACAAAILVGAVLLYPFTPTL